MSTVDHISTLAVAPTGSKSPDSITLANGDIWVAYTNGADSTGLSGFSTIVEYDRSGHFDHSYQINGYVDGLKFDPFSGDIWALQNQDGNSTLSIIDPKHHTVSKPLPYAVPSDARGYDDVVFTHGKEFLSYTNPVNPGDVTLVQLTNGNDPDGPLTTKAILKFGDQGLNLETGKMACARHPRFPHRVTDRRTITAQGTGHPRLSCRASAKQDVDGRASGRSRPSSRDMARP